MKIPRSIEREIKTKLLSMDSTTFEEFCISMFKESNRNKGIRTDNFNVVGNSQQGVPDAYIYDERRDKYVIFEFTITKNKGMTGYVKNLISRQYLKEIRTKIEKFVLVTTAILANEQKLRFRKELADAFECKCYVKDNDDILQMLVDGKHDLISEYLGINIGPKFFKSVDETLKYMSETALGFPSIEAFSQESIYLSTNVNEAVMKCLETPSHISALLYGKWGSGKTVTGLLMAKRLQKRGLTAYYLDLARKPATDEIAFADSIITESFRPSAGKDVLFILDNAHALPRASYRLAKHLISNHNNLIMMSRPVPEEIDDEYYYYPNLFMNENCSLIKTTLSFDTLKEIALHYNNNVQTFEDSEINSICNVVGPNITLLKLYLDYKVKYPNIDPKKKIYEYLINKFSLNQYPEWCVIASISTLDCAVDLRAAIPDINRRNQFIKHIGEGRKKLPVQILGYDFLVGLSAAEGTLICEAGIASNLVINNNKTFYSLTESIKSYITYYCHNRPQNPYKVLSALRWAAFESREEICFSDEEKYVNIINEILEDNEFVLHLRYLYSNRLSSIALGEFFRIVYYANVKRTQAQSIIDKDTIRNGMINVQRLLAERNRPLFFSWREYFAWRHIKSVDLHLAEYFLSFYDDDLLKKYGASIGQLVNLMYIALTSKRISSLLRDNIDELFADLGVQTAKCHEVLLVFLLRNASYMGHDVIKNVCGRIAPTALANNVKRCKYSSSIIYAVYKHTFPAYFNEFISVFSSNDIYDRIYLESLAKISWTYDDGMFNRFIRYDFLVLFKKSDLKEIQLFLRNVSRHAFKEAHRRQVTAKISQKPCIEHILNKFSDKSTSLRDINYFVSNLYILNSAAAKHFLKILSEKQLQLDLIQRGTLADLGIFLTHCHFLISISGCPISYEVITNYIIQRQHQTTAYDFLVIGGYLSLINSNYEMPINYNQHNDLFKSFFKRNMIVWDDDDIDAVAVSSCFRFSVLIYGILYYKKDLKDYFDAESIKEIVERFKNVLQLFDSAASTNEIDLARKSVISKVFELFLELDNEQMGSGL